MDAATVVPTVFHLGEARRRMIEITTIRLGWQNAHPVPGDRSVLFDAGSPGDERASPARVGPGRKHRPGRRLRR